MILQPTIDRETVTSCIDALRAQEAALALRMAGRPYDADLAEAYQRVSEQLTFYCRLATWNLPSR